MKKTMWMVRAGEGGYLFEDFAKGYVAVGWNNVGDLSEASTPKEIKKLYLQNNPDDHPSKASNAAAMIYKFRSNLTTGSYYTGAKCFLI